MFGSCAVDAPTGSCRRVGFTLIELLMVITIMAVMGLLALGLLRGAREDSYKARTESILAQCKTVLQTKLESYETRTLPFRPTDVYTPHIPNRSQLAALKNRMVVEWVLSEMPTCYEQLASFPSAASQFTIDSQMTGHDLGRSLSPPIPTSIVDHPEYWDSTWVPNFVAQINLRGQSSSALLLQQVLNPPAGDNFPGDIVPPGTGVGQSGFDYALFGGRDLLFAIPGAFDAAMAEGTPQRESLTEGAELLYAILYTTWDGDRRGNHFLSGREIGDTDKDGRLEVLDAFGDPMFFMIRRNVISSNGEEDVNENGTTLSGGDLSDRLLNPNKPIDVWQFEIDIRSINMQ